MRKSPSLRCAPLRASSGILHYWPRNYDALLANEIAPRVHNSGHWSIEGAECSQFENHLRAVAGLPLGSTALRCASLMYNCIGTEPEHATVLAAAGAHLHSYGKTAKPGRKLAHVTFTARDDVTLDTIIDAVRTLFER